MSIITFFDTHTKQANDKMIGNTLKRIFDTYLDLQLNVWENFGKIGQIIDLPRNSIIKESNSIERYFYIIIKGSGGNLIWSKNNFICIDISFENDFLNDYMSFTLQKPSPIEVRLFEDSQLFRISHEKFKLTFNAENYGEKVTRICAEYSFIYKQQQQIDLLTKSAKERYIELINTKKGVERIPLKYLASYLGITPQSLSRIRSQKL